MRVSCDVPRETYGPLLRLVERVGFLLGERDASSTHPLLEQARSHVFEIGRRALGERAGARSPLGDVVASLNRLAETRVTVVLDAADAADEATLEALVRVVAKPGWLKVPIVLGARTREPTGAFGDLVAAIRAAEGERSVLAFAPASAQAVVASKVLPTETRTVLRAASVLGPAFELELLASIVDLDPIEVLAHLQEASDLGVHVQDRGDGTFALDGAQIAELEAGTLPSLRTVFHRRAAEAVSPIGADEPLRPERDPSPPSPQPTEPGPTEADALREAEALGARATRGPESVEEAARDGARRGGGGGEAPPARDHARAEQHYVAAGDALRAVEQTILAGAKAARLGAHAKAEALITRALAVVRELPVEDASRRLEIAALLELGRVRLEGFAPDATERFELNSAIEPLESARSLIVDRDPPEIHVRAAALHAAALTARGDLESLDRALEALVQSSRLLVERGEARHATRLLNDQAAVYLKMGDPVRAMSLLERSRKMFEARADSDPAAREESADTDHLIARVPLHVAARPGREDDALSAALDHAISARRAYVQMGDARSAASVDETIGRLELARGRIERALDALRSALGAQRRLGDLVGLARTTAALADALARAGRVDDALALLSESIRFNRAKGSLAGVAYNRRALEAFGEASLQGAAPARVAEAMQELEEAERHLGAIHLPGVDPSPRARAAR